MSSLPGLSLDDMRELLRKGLGGLDDTDLPDAEADRLLNMALWEIEDKFGFKNKECIRTGTLTIGERIFPLPNDIDALNSVSVQELNGDSGQWRKLGRMSEDHWDEIRNDRDDTRQRPLLYFRYRDNIIVWPTPDKEYPIQLIMWRSLQSLLDGTIETTGLPRNWDEMVVEGAVTRGHFYNQDYVEARQSANFQIGKIRGAELVRSKEEKFDSRYAQLVAIVDGMDFIDDAELPFQNSFVWHKGLGLPRSRRGFGGMYW